jgi:hypothetical protein
MQGFFHFPRSQDATKVGIMSRQILTQAEIENLPEGTMIYLDTDVGKIVGRIQRSRRKSKWIGMYCLSSNAIHEWFRIDIRTYPKDKSPYFKMTDEDAMLFKLENA